PATAAPTTRAPDGPTAFPFRRGCPFFPPDEYARLRRDAPVTRVTLPTGGQAWIVTRYRDVRALLADPRISSDARHPTFPAMGAGEREAAARNRPFIRTDPPEHTRIRRMVQAEFTVRRVKNMVPELASYAEGLVDDMVAAGPPADLVSAYANQMSTVTVLNLMGVPTEDVEFFRDVTRISGGRTSSAEQVQAALGGMFARFDELIERRLREPGEDLFSRLVINNLATGAMTRQELLSTVGITVIAGRETTTSMIALGTLMLLERPDALAELRERPDLLGEAVEELLRMLSVADSIPLRVATGEIEISGVTIRPGDGVILLLAAANHDPEVFPEPTALDLHRPDRHHVAFGFGIHQCVGQNLARAELEVALGTLLRRLPTLRLAAPFEELELRQDAATFGIETLPVAW
ncbi:cytochrome P450, partial [Parafrankia sp. FMc6]|uniref:cytochrome P450 n=1 Tax=Parafrankia soli TaxID=2599596 RepID=UPI0034D3F7F9